jgi:hypothetical protein
MYCLVHEEKGNPLKWPDGECPYLCCNEPTEFTLMLVALFPKHLFPELQ